MNEWISVEDELPPEHELVIVAQVGVEDAAPFVAFYFHEEKTWAFMANTFHPTHWMHLPPLPEALP